MLGRILVITLLGTATGGYAAAQTITATMETVRTDHPLAEGGGNNAASSPLVGADGLMVETAPPVPTLLLGVRDASGFKGYADAADGIDLSPDSTMMIGSQTKTFTAAAILQLDQEGVLSIKDTLADPKWADVLRWPNAEAITIEMVLSHTAGIPEFAATRGFQTGMSDPAWAPSGEDMIAFARSAEPTFPPGEGWRYSNTDYIILGVIIEKVTGNSYASEMRTRFFEPLGLIHTRVYDPSSPKPAMPSYILWCAGQAAQQSDQAPTAADGPPACPSGAGEWRPMGPPYDHIWPLIGAAGGIQSSTSDMTRWITDLVATDNVLDADHRRLMQTPAAHSKLGIAQQFPKSLAASMVGYGLGLIVFDYDIGTGYGHTGNTPGYASNSVYFPGHDNDFAMTIVSGESVVEVAAGGSNAIATAIKETR